MSARSSATRYGSVAIAIHWLTALLIVLLFVTGLSAAGQTDESVKIALLRAHVPLGIAALLLTLFRVAWWLAADRRRPAMRADQPGWQKAMAKAVHFGLYLVILVSATSGIATIVLSGALPAIIAGTALPDFNTVLPRAVHGVAFRIMLVLLALHFGAALYHQFIRRDHLMARMGIGEPGPAAKDYAARLRR
jgi:cytochrome b561